ncbi:MAG: helix-turn-helix domain-containing protein, partial [Bacteroidales bacterium]|nr:helix-turn-helix domain-containing protein [Bacteroidales bacterium]
FGKEFVELISKYVTENEIERPVDFVVKSVVNKSAIKVSIIQGIDRKLPLEDIAESKGLEMDEILNEIEAIVNSGTKINIDYYIRQTIDEDKTDDIYEYFRTEAVSDSLKEASDELGRGYTEEEIRLVRIKFLAEMGN